MVGLGRVGSRPGHGSMARGKQAWSDPEAGGCCQAEGGRRVKATSSVHHTCGCFCGLYKTAREVHEGRGSATVENFPIFR